MAQWADALSGQRAFIDAGVLTVSTGQTRDLSQVGNCDFLEMVQFRCHKQRLDMTKTELQVALAAATETNKRTAGVFLETLSALAYKEIKKNGEFVLPGFGKLVKQKRKARTGFNPKTQQKIKIPACAHRREKGLILPI